MPLNSTLVIALFTASLLSAQAPPVRVYDEPQTAPQKAAAAPAASLTAQEEELRAIAERFAPVIYQRMAGSETEHRFDYPTVFDFDGDWVGNNNWEHAADAKYPLWSFVYYSAIESEDYYFLHYALYHPRDWSLVQGAYDSTLDALQQKYQDMVGAGMRKEAEFNHENDLEGILVIVDKWTSGGPAPIAMETVAHNYLLKAIAPAAGLRFTGRRPAEVLRLENGHPVIYVESQKHGIHPYTGQTGTADQPIVVLRLGKSTEFSPVRDGRATYDLVSIRKTFWKHALETRQPNTTYGTVEDFGDRFCSIPGARRPDCQFGAVGMAFRGDVARPNAANAPWAWIDKDDPGLPTGAWFFDPALLLARHFGVTDLKEKYLYNPYLGIEAAPAPAKAAEAH